VGKRCDGQGRLNKAEFPNPNLQAPKNFQTPMTKPASCPTKLYGSGARTVALSRFGIWGLRFRLDLGFENLVYRTPRMKGKT